MSSTRRLALAGGAAVIATGAYAQSGPRRVDPLRVNRDLTLAHGVMADNLVARSFRLAPSNLRVPKDLVVTDLKGRRTLGDYLGRTLIVPIWAEWCPPCLIELGDFAKLQGRYGSPSFGILPVLTGANDQMAPYDVVALLQKARAEVFAPLMEDRGEGRLYRAMTSNAPVGQTPGSLPCTLLVNETGLVVARQWGAGADPKSPSAAGPDWSWSSPMAEAFVKATAGGFLSRS